jgi:hypothetical protein
MELASLYSFENEEKVFPGVHNQFKFALVCLDLAGRVVRSDLMFFARQSGDLADASRHFSMAPSDFSTLNPNTGTCPTFRSRRDADIGLAIYGRTGVLWHEDSPSGNPWHLQFLRMFDMANDSGLFRTRSRLETDGPPRADAANVGPLGTHVPLLEAKMVHLFDHRFSTYENATQANLNKGTLPRLNNDAHASPVRLGVPEYWVARQEVDDRLRDRSARGWLVGWRDIARSVDERTVIASLIPRLAVGHKFPLMLSPAHPPAVAALYANLCSFALDYSARQKLGGASLTYFVLKQLPVLPPSTYETSCRWVPDIAGRAWLLPRVLELTYTAWDLEPFAHDVGYDGPPFRWDPERRFLLRCELDAAFFHLYGLNRDDTDYVMDTFPIVRKNDEKAHGEYRTKRVILEIYDAMAEAIRTGKPYQTRLNPLPADPSVAHPGRGVSAWTALDLAALPDAAWERPCDNMEAEAGLAIAAVLKAVAAPTPAGFVRLAALLSLEPRLLLPSLATEEAVSWRRLVGREAETPPAGVTALVPPDDRAWGSAVRRLRGNAGFLVEDLAGKTWAPGAQLSAIETDAWADGRACFVLGVLSRRSERNVLQTLPEATQRRIDGAAA